MQRCLGMVPVGNYYDIFSFVADQHVSCEMDYLSFLSCASFLVRFGRNVKIDISGSLVSGGIKTDCSASRWSLLSTARVWVYWIRIQQITEYLM